MSEDLSCYHGVFGFDVESDNSTSDLALPGDLNITNNSDCSPQTKDVNADLFVHALLYSLIIFLCPVIAMR